MELVGFRHVVDVILCLIKQLSPNPTSQDSEETDYFEVVFGLNKRQKHNYFFWNKFLPSSP